MAAIEGVPIMLSSNNFPIIKMGDNIVIVYRK
jgi:hypothetical protein